MAICRSFFSEYPKSLLARALEFDRRSFYTKYLSGKSDADIANKIIEIYQEDDTLGPKKLSAMIGIGKHRCNRIMNVFAIVPRKKQTKYNKNGLPNIIYPNLLLDADSEIENHIFFSDMFEFVLVDNTEVHGAFVLKKSTRQIIGILFDYSENSMLIVNTLQQAAKHMVNKGIFHSDQGSVYGSKITTSCVENLELEISMSRAGTPTDNPFAERFVQTFKLAVVYRRPYLTLADFLETAQKWVNFYNMRRPHESLGQIPPNDYAIAIGEKSLSIKSVFSV